MREYYLSVLSRNFQVSWRAQCLWNHSSLRKFTSLPIGYWSMQSLGKCEQFIRKGAEWWWRRQDLQKLYWIKTSDQIGLHKSGFVGDHSHSERRFEMLDTSAVVRYPTGRSFTWSSQLAAGSSYAVANRYDWSYHWPLSSINWFSLKSIGRCSSFTRVICFVFSLIILLYV